MRGNKSRGTGRSLGSGRGGYGGRSGLCHFGNQGAPQQPGRGMNRQGRFSEPDGSARRTLQPAGPQDLDNKDNLSRRTEENTKKLETLLEKLETLTARQE